MELTIIIIVISFCILCGYMLWKLLEAQEDIKWLKHEVEYLKHLQSQEPEQQINIDYEILKEEL